MYVQRVALKDVKCHAFHGYYPQEQLIGCNFLVDVEVTFHPSGDTEDLNKTVNYEALNELINTEMRSAQKLLETVVHRIMDGVRKQFPFILTAKVGIKKVNPPMPGEIGCSFVELSYTAD